MSDTLSPRSPSNYGMVVCLRCRNTTWASSQDLVMQGIGTRRKSFCVLVVEDQSIKCSCVGVVAKIDQGYLCHQYKLQSQGEVKQNLCLHWPVSFCDLQCCSWRCSPEPVSWDFTAICWISYYPSVFSFKSNIGFIFSSIKKKRLDERNIFFFILPPYPTNLGLAIFIRFAWW